MTLHLCKDFLAKHNTAGTVYMRYYGLCLSSYFLNGVLGFSQVGHTNFNLNSGSITKGSGANNANINLGVGLERAVQVPSGSYVVSTSDIDRVLALKSNLYPMMNSGLFRISGFDSTTNSLILKSRSWLDPPPPETNMTWKLFENEGTVTDTFANTQNTQATTAYRGWGDSTTSRIILQSPHASAWQVRICAEVPVDVNDVNVGENHLGAACTFAPGFGGNSAGDFAVGGQHLHAPLFFNIGPAPSDTTRTVATVPGLASTQTQVPGRYYMWGDDATGTCFIVGRQHGSTEAEAIIVFGFPEDEQQPTPTLTIQRLFSYGSTFKSGQSTAIKIKPGTYNGSGEQQIGAAFGLGLQPITCIASSWAFLSSQASNSGIMNDAVASDGVYLGATELWGWDLYAGTYDNANNVSTSTGGGSVISLEPRRMGRLPYARRGRENFNKFSTSVDQSRQWIHLDQGIYLPWSGSIVP